MTEITTTHESVQIVPAKRDANGWTPPAMIATQKQMIVEAVGSYMVEGEDFGTIPGAGEKKVLMKSGAEKLCFIFGIIPVIDTQIVELGNGHREYRSKCTLYDTHGQKKAVLSGSCSTMEKKYRYRNDTAYEILDEPIPKEYWKNKKKFKPLGAKKINGQWTWVKYGSSEKVENPDIADVWNTVLKMSEKRSFVAAVLVATAASSMFTQDLEEGLPPAQDGDKQPEPAPAVILATEEQVSEFAQILGQSSLDDEQVQMRIDGLRRQSTEDAAQTIETVKQQAQQAQSIPAPTDEDIPF